MHDSEPIFDSVRMLEIIAEVPFLRREWKDSDKSHDTLVAMFNSWVLEGQYFDLYRSWGMSSEELV